MLTALSRRRPAVDVALADFRVAPISERLKATLAFLEIMTLRPMELSAGDAKAVLHAGVIAAALMDAIAVGALFSIVTRYADALDCAVPTTTEFDRAENMFLKRGYAS